MRLGSTWGPLQSAVQLYSAAALVMTVDIRLDLYNRSGALPTTCIVCENKAGQSYGCLKKLHQHQRGTRRDVTTPAQCFICKKKKKKKKKKKRRKEPKVDSERFRSSSEMCSLNRTVSLCVFPREPAAGLDATVDYVKVGTINVRVCCLQKRRCCYYYSYKQGLDSDVLLVEPCRQFFS